MSNYNCVPINIYYSVYMYMYLCVCVCVCARTCTHMHAQLCLTLCDPMDYSLLDLSVHGISKERILEWVAISFFRGLSWPRDQIHISCVAGGFYTTETPGKPMCVCVIIQFSSVQLLSRVRLFVTPWTRARQAFLSIINSRSLLKLMSHESVMPSNHLTLSSSSCLKFFAASGSF